MIFYSGFSFTEEEKYFQLYLDRSDFSVAGFSYGAIKALEAVEQKLSTGKRVDKLQLLSPAFFQTTTEKFKRLQLMGYSKNPQRYLKEFKSLCFAPYKALQLQQIQTVHKELETLLYFVWKKERLQYIARKGVVIEVYIGGEDKIIDPSAARDFFKEVATVTYIKTANHFLQFNEGDKIDE